MVSHKGNPIETDYFGLFRSKARGSYPGICVYLAHSRGLFPAAGS